jgi:hypothetical protein
MNTLRTTVTLDADVAEQLREMSRRRNISFKSAINTAVREGLAAERGEITPYEVPTQPMGWRPGVDLTHALRFAAELEDEEIIRKMALRK